MPRTVGLFSTEASGVYGMPGYSIANDSQRGAILISAGAEARKLHLPGGISLLLETHR